jgi:hypothetical protein
VITVHAGRVLIWESLATQLCHASASFLALVLRCLLLLGVGRIIDAGLIYGADCSPCVKERKRCGGYGVKLQWPEGTYSHRVRETRKAAIALRLENKSMLIEQTSQSFHGLTNSYTADSSMIKESLSPFSPNLLESVLLQHYMRKTLLV